MNRHIVVISFLLVILISTVELSCRSSHDLGSSALQEAASNAPPVAEKRRKRLADGCYNVFVDVGANIGVHTRFLYEPQKYPNTAAAVSHFHEHFGPDRDNRDYCSFSFEPNPAHKSRHLKMKYAYERMGWRYHPIFAGAGDEEGNLTFYHMNDRSKKEFGFNSLRKRNARGEKGEAEVVPVVRLATFLREEIRDRALPEKVHSSFASAMGPKVVLKMDIEGMEYIVLPDLVTSGALCQTVDFYFGEFHPQYFFFPIDRKETHGGLYLENAPEGQKFGETLVRAMKSSQHCKTIFSTEDDETYLKDQDGSGRAIPFPEPPNATVAMDS